MSKNGWKYQRSLRRWPPNGHVTLTRKGAAAAFEDGKTVTVCGNNVNHAHVFGGWTLGWTFHKEDGFTRRDSAANEFNERVDSFISYLDRELGTYPVFYIRKEDLQ